MNAFIQRKHLQLRSDNYFLLVFIFPHPDDVFEKTRFANESAVGGGRILPRWCHDLFTKHAKQPSAAKVSVQGVGEAFSPLLGLAEGTEIYFRFFLTASSNIWEEISLAACVKRRRNGANVFLSFEEGRMYS